LQIEEKGLHPNEFAAVFPEFARVLDNFATLFVDGSNSFHHVLGRTGKIASVTGDASGGSARASPGIPFAAGERKTYAYSRANRNTNPDSLIPVSVQVYARGHRSSLSQV
jgi:hypothetical protein